MGKGLDKRKRPRRWWTFLLVGTLCLSGCSASGWTAGHNDATAMIGHVDQESLQSNRFTHMEGDGGKALPQLALDGFSLVAENDTLGLYLREQYACIRVLDKATGYVWGSFREDEPEDLNETWARFGNSVVSLECIDSTGMTKKAAAGQDETSRRYTWLDDGFTCAIDFGEEINIAVTVSVRLGENRLLFSVDDASIREEGEYFIHKLYFAPFLGCTRAADTDGYMLIPDGSGALIRYQEPMQVLRPYSARVYGLDQAIDNLSELNDLEVNRPKEFLTESNTVTMPVFGLTHGVRKQALFGRVKAGAAYAYIEATPAGFVTDYNWATASFLYRQTYLQPTSKKGDGVPILQKERNPVNPSLELYFLNGQNADYNGMASLYADILLREGMLGRNQNGLAPQVALDVIVADAEKALIGHNTKRVSSLEYVTQAVERLHGNGLRRMAVSLLGWQKGGLSGYTKSRLYDRTAWGSFTSLQALSAELDQNGGQLLFYMDPLRAKDIQINPRRDSAIGMSQNPIKVESLDKGRFLGDIWYVKGTAGLNYLHRQAAVLTEAGHSMAIDGAGLLYGEYLADAFVTRADMLLRQQEVYRALAEKSGPLTLYGPNDYLFPYTGVYRDTPMAGNQDIFETDSVPFLQLVLSGHMRLIAPYANENFYSRTDLLKCMEYNVYPSFLLTEEPNSALSKTTLWTTSSSQFEQWEEIIRELTGAVCEVLEPVQGERMVRHTAIAPLVYAITYESGTVYVNYGGEVYTTGSGETVPAESGRFVPFSAEQRTRGE